VSKICYCVRGRATSAVSLSHDRISVVPAHVASTTLLRCSGDIFILLWNTRNFCVHTPKEFSDTLLARLRR
jgi:hypothetical protein